MNVTAYWLIKDNRRADKLGYRMKQFSTLREAVKYISKFKSKMIYKHFDFKYNMTGHMSCYKFDIKEEN